MKSTGINQRLRNLHRDIGFLLIGITLIYCVSGFVLVYRETGFLKSEQAVSAVIAKGLEAEQLGQVLHKKVRITGDMEDSIFFSVNGQEGTYNRVTGEVSYTDSRLPGLLEKMNSLHKTSSTKSIHVLSVVYAALLLFLAVSSFWMYKPGTRLFKRGLMFSAAGFAVSFMLLLV